MVSPVQRIPFPRSQRLFSPDVLRLFSELERVKPAKRFHYPRTKELAQRLDLVDEYLTCCVVSDSDLACYHPEGVGYVRNDHVRTCRHVREMLLAATGLAKKRPAEPKPERGASTMTEKAQSSHGSRPHVTPRTRLQ
jgi:hypothetical protein